MIKSMTGFSKTEVQKNGFHITVELKSLNGRYLEISPRLPRSLNHKEFEIKDLIKKVLTRGSVYCNINIEYDSSVQQFVINQELATQYFNGLKKLKNKLKLRDQVTMDHLMNFSQNFTAKEEKDTSDAEWNLTKPILNKAIKDLDKMRTQEGNRIARDMNMRMNRIAKSIEKIDALGLDKIPAERERLRMRVAQLFESDEIDEHRLQTELVLLADKLDISEECVRMRSHIKFYNETMKSNIKDAVGKKINFLLQEMNREINTIGSKCNDAEIAQMVVHLKEELERIREQTQNIE